MIIKSNIINMLRDNGIRSYIEQNLLLHPADIVSQTARQLRVSRQAVHKRVKRLISDGVVRKSGRTKGTRYELIPYAEHTWSGNIADGFEEHVVWEQEVRPHLAGARENVVDILDYTVTEMLNNAHDHSGGSVVILEVTVYKPLIIIRILDDGVGVFQKIRRECGLEDDREAILELSKGKLTTDPERHTGEGIFFTSRMLDAFVLASGGMSLVHMRQSGDWLVNAESTTTGTFVSMELATNSTLTSKEVLDRFASGEDVSFSKTHVVVKLAATGPEKLISRSQAKRVLARLDRFREAVLDFTDVDSIGPAFADEIFRVFATAHPEVAIAAISAAPEVQRMIDRAKTGLPQAPRRG